MTSNAITRVLAQSRNLILTDANEAATRLKVIDVVLREILKWTDDDISPEEHVSEDGGHTFADYILRTANTAIVVEAKKAGAAFSASGTTRRVKLSNSFIQSEIGAAILQARDYARKLSIDFAVATNGSMWAVFPAQRHDQVRFQDSTALVFWSLEDALNENYQEFYELLSRVSVISGSLERALLGRTEDQLENRKLNSFFLSNLVTTHNPIFPVIEDEVMAAFSDSIVDLPEESFEKCYVATPESMKFDHKIRMHIAKRDAVVGGAVTRPMKDQDSTALFKRLQESTKKRRALALLVLGTVGAGKTTFLHYARKVRLRESFTQVSKALNPQWLHIDFLNFPPGTSASDFVYRALLEHINRDKILSDYHLYVKHAYANEIAAIKRGPLSSLAKDEEKISEKISDFLFKEYQDVRPYVDKLIRHAVANASFFLAIDNIDQIEDDEAQSSLFTEALAISRSLGVNLILSLRSATFAKHRNSPGIDAFDFETIQIDPPRIASVISKRFGLVKYLATGKAAEFTAENGARVKMDDASQIVDLLQGSVLGTEIGTRIEVLATEDVRLALRMTREFLERGYSNPGRALAFHRSTGKYVLPRHEAFRAILLGTRTVYSEDSSSIGNPFDSRFSVSNAQLLRIYVLQAVVAYASESGFRFIDGMTIAENLRKIGFGDRFTERVLVDLCKNRFLFTASHGEASLAASYIPSRLGGYVARELISNFTFVENTLFDTYIADTQIWQSIKAISYQIEGERQMLPRIKLRIQRLRLFYDYVNKSYAPLMLEARKRGLSAQWCGSPFEERRRDFRDEIAAVLASARRANRKNLAARVADFSDLRNEEDLSAV